MKLSSSEPGYLGWLNGSHFEVINNALCNVLATDLALETFAQIIDGLPVSVIVRESSRKIGNRHPINCHVELCRGVREKAMESPRDLNLGILKIDQQLLEAFQKSPRNSRSFELSLLKLTAVALHQIAVFLVHEELHLHNPATIENMDVAAITSWERPPDIWAPVTPYPTLFTHPGFAAYQQYPAGIADMVGYWAEDRVFGGVALFDYSQSWDHSKEPNVYFQSGRVSVKLRICQLHDAQQHELLKFLLADTEQSQINCPLPVLPSKDNTMRIDPVDATPLHKVYRNLWEREGPKLRYRMQEYMGSCIDYPEVDVDAEIERLNSLGRVRRIESSMLSNMEKV